MALNDNRAVYRSRFLLDRDLASKNIDLSNVYRELSLDDWGIQKATEAVREDYANASGHLYYAGALTDADDRSYARNTENLLARLLIPATANAFNTFEDYTTFLERPNFETQVTAAFGNLDHRGIEALHYGASPRHDIANQVGVLAETTRGWRTTNGEASENLVGFLKWNPSENQGVMLAASLANFRQNDIAAPRFEHDDPGQPNDELDSKLTPRRGRLPPSLPAGRRPAAARPADRAPDRGGHLLPLARSEYHLHRRPRPDPLSRHLRTALHPGPGGADL